MAKRAVKEGSLCFMLDGKHKGSVGVCVDISPKESKMRKYDFVFPDGSEYLTDNKKIPKKFRRLSYIDFV